jgi:hypothetical protein
VKKSPEYRYDKYGRFRLIVRAEGYVMARRTGCGPVIMSEKEWSALSGSALPDGGPAS